jgi:hypothetical protein
MRLRHACAVLVLTATLALSGCGGPAPKTGAAAKPAATKTALSAQATDAAATTGTGTVAEPSAGPADPKDMVEWTGPIMHIFTHQLIAWPDKAANGKQAASLDTNMLDVTEFKRLLQQLYDNGYALIDINSTYKVVGSGKDAKVVKAKLMVPMGKKPLIYSIDDVRYDYRVQGTGSVDRLIVDKDGKIATFTKAANSDTGQDEVRYDNDVYPILEDFVAKHPDFSVNGAKATLGMTGYVSLFGYRTDRLQGSIRASEIEKAKVVAAWFKEHGWNFATHGYAHLHSAHVTTEKLRSDAQKWRNEVENVVGPAHTYIWPFGESVPYGSASRTMLINEFDWRMFCPVDTHSPTDWEGASVSNGRAPMDGLSLRHFRKTYAKELGIDTAAIFDAPYRERLNPKGGPVK